ARQLHRHLQGGGNDEVQDGFGEERRDRHGELQAVTRATAAGRSGLLSRYWPCRAGRSASARAIPATGVPIAKLSRTTVTREPQNGTGVEAEPTLGNEPTLLDRPTGKVTALLAAIKARAGGRHVVVIRGYPDPDSLASGWAHSRLAA